jgi:hypothetical protein
MKKPYSAPKLDVFGTVADLTLNGCTQAGTDPQYCKAPGKGFNGSGSQT